MYTPRKELYDATGLFCQSELHRRRLLEDNKKFPRAQRRVSEGASNRIPIEDRAAMMRKIQGKDDAISPSDT